MYILNCIFYIDVFIYAYVLSEWTERTNELCMSEWSYYKTVLMGVCILDKFEQLENTHRAYSKYYKIHLIHAYTYIVNAGVFILV